MSAEIMRATKAETFFNEEYLVKNSLILIDHGDYELALSLLNSVLNEKPNNKDALRWKGYCLFQTGQKEKALDPFIKLAELEPTEANYYQLADTLYDCGQDELSKVFFQKAIDVIDYDSPFLFPIYKKLGNLFVKTQDYDAAEEYYNKAYILNTHSDELFVNYGTLELQRGNLDIAQDRFKQALDLNLNNVNAWLGLSLVNRCKHDKELSWANLFRALDLDVSNPNGLKICIDWALEDFEFEKAILRLEKYFKTSEPSVEWSVAYAGLLFQSGDWKNAQQKLEEILSVYPGFQPAVDMMMMVKRSKNI